MPRPREQRTYRLRQLPQHLERQDIGPFLCKVFPDFGPEEDIQIFSLAKNLIGWEKPPTKIATLVFRKTPETFDNDEGEWTFSARNAGWNRKLIFDTHFKGFTPLNDVDQSIHLADCIAISGLASHSFGSWMQRCPHTNFMWLRDKLPKDVPRFRQIIYGYDTSLTGNESFQIINDIALSLIAKLRSIGRTSMTAKPLIFFAHSLGGIVLKHALVTMAGSCGAEKLILEKIKGFFFFGVPHLGMEMSHLLAIVKGQPNEPFVRALSHEDGYLLLLDEQFRGISFFSRARIISAYETKLSRSAQMSTGGTLVRTSDPHVAVNRLSAIHRSSETQFPINRDHSDLVKFSELDEDYDIVVSYLHELVDSLSPPDAIAYDELGLGTSGEDTTSSIRRQLLKSKTTDTRISVDESNIDDAKHRLRVMREQQAEDDRLFKQMNKDRSSATSMKLLDEKIFERLKLIAALEGNIEFVPKKSTLRKDLIESLHISDLSHRSEKIEAPATGTFDWIFEDTNLNFTHWLRNEIGIYWIRGKPGSGKSTLMKYLQNHSRTSNIWKPEGILVDVYYFFDNRGSHIQKSLEGLLHAILHRISSSDRRLADIILLMYAEKPADRRDKWPLLDLQNALMLLLNQTKFSLDLRLFLDALDEVDDPPEVIADFVADISRRSTSSTKIKVCFSSRPWNVFLDRFDVCPGFNVHEHTKSDIRHFAWRSFVQNQIMTKSQTGLKNTNYLDLLDDIAGRAEGVFLWVKLVSTEIVRAHREGASFAKLRQLVSDFPQELEDFYSRIVDQLPQSRRFEAFAMLEVVIRTKEMLSVEDFMGAIRCAPIKTFNQRFLDTEFQYRTPALLEEIKRQLRDYTGGLLEIVLLTDSPIVQLMHQTVKDFISTPGFMPRLLGSEAGDIRENGHSFLAKHHIAKTIMGSHTWNESIAECALLGMLNAHLSETTTGISQRVFLDSLKDSSIAQGFQRFMDVNSRLSLAVVADLRLYVRERLTELNTINDNPSLSLLYCLTSCTAMRSLDNVPAEDESTQLFRRPREVPWEIVNGLDLTDMCKILLEFGASVRTRSESLTPFQALFAPRVEFGAAGSPSTSQSRAVTRVLLKHGQDPGDALDFSKHRPGLPSCKAIHISDAKMSTLLLDYGADVNALDSCGRTPLDITLSPNLETLEFSSPDKVCDRISVLLDRGACVTKHGEYNLKRCVDWLNEYGSCDHLILSVLAGLERVQRLSSTLRRRTTSRGHPTPEERLLNPAQGPISNSNASTRLPGEPSNLPTRRFEIRPRWMSNTTANSTRRADGDGN